MQTVTLTSKRQATFPEKLCRELDVKPGNKILLERREIDGRPAWILRTNPRTETEWFGILRRYAEQKPHDLKSIRESIGKKRAGKTV